MVIHKTLTTLSDNSNEEWLWNNIFKTHCKSQDKVCSIVIDNNNCENIGSQDIVNKLKLKINHILNHIESHGSKRQRDVYY